MIVQPLHSGTGAASNGHYSQSLLLNDHIAIDAGCLGWAPMPVQLAVRHVLLSHCHMDHLASLPIFLDNVYRPGPDCPVVHAGSQVGQVLQSHIFNDLIWPDLGRLSQNETPFLELRHLVPEETVEIEGLRIRPVELNHIVPTLGFIVEDDDCAIVIASDTTSTDRLWELAGELPHLRGVFLEVAFPDSMRDVADRAQHLTPSLFRAELEKLSRQVPVLAIHLKPAYQEEIVRELKQLAIPNVEIAEPGRTYQFT